MKIKFGLSLLAVTALLIAGVFSRTALADYPPPNGSVEFSVSNTTAGVGQGVTLTLIVLDAAGNPVANAACAMSIASQPGSDASVAQHSAETDANGAITGTLDVGSSPGSVVVTASCPVGPDSSDVLSASGTVVVAGAVGPASPPASLPSTGVGMAGSETGTGYGQLAFAFAAVGGALLAFGAVSRAARRRSL